MKLLKGILIGVFFLLVVISAGIYFYLTTTLPEYSGTVQLQGLEKEVSVFYDDYGVPHIYAENDEDAHFALGFVHAQDRLFQMEMIRRVMKGRLSEVLGSDFVKTDQFFRTLGLEETAKKSANKYLIGSDEKFAKLALAYQAGVNQFIEEGSTPIEFTIMGIPKTKFIPEDMYLVVGFMSVGFAEALKTDPVLSYIQQKFGNTYLDALAVQSIPHTEFIPSYDTSVFSENNTVAMAQLLNKIPVPLFSGSNSWIVGPKKSATGTPIFANDTHIGFSQPSVWYEAHLNYPGQSLYGNYAAGFPFAILGHNQKAAWGLTMLENDDMDFFIETINEKDSLQFLHDSMYYQINSRYDTLMVKDADPLIFPIQNSKHGPIINNVLTNFPKTTQNPVSIWWEFTQKESELLQACYQMNTAESIMDFKFAAGKINSPGLNVMCADVLGNIGWFSAARLVERPKHVNPSLFLDGTGADDIMGAYNYSENPHTINPPWNYVYSANNQPDSIMGRLYPGYYLPEDRAMRIVELLESKEKWSIEDMKQINLDVLSRKDVEVAKVITGVLEGSDLNQKEKQVIDILSDWDGDESREGVAPTIYYTLLSNIMDQAMADELGEVRYNEFNSVALMKRSYLKFVSNEDSPWWDNVNTSEKEDRSAIILSSLKATIEVQTERLGEDIENWNWSKVHTLTHGHPLGAVKLLAPYFNVGPYPVDGGSETINNLMFKLNKNGLFPVTAGPALRKLIDLGDLNSAQSVLPSGQSGNFMSNNYSNQGELYANGHFRKLLFAEDQVRMNSKSELTLIPNNE